MVSNPLPPVIQHSVHALLKRAESLDSNFSEERAKEIEDMIVHLHAYLTSDEEPWPDYRKSVPWDLVNREFSNRITQWKREEQNLNPYTGNPIQQIKSILADASFHPTILENNEGVTFIGNPKKAAENVEAHIESNPFSIVKNHNGGVFLRLGSNFTSMKPSYSKGGTAIYEAEQFDAVISDVAHKNPAFKQFLTESLGSLQTFATEDFAAPDFSGIKTTNTENANIIGGSTTSQTQSPAPSGSETSDSKECMIPNDFLKIVTSNLHLLPPEVDTLITNEIVKIECPRDDPDPDPQPPKCRPVLKREPPDARMTRIDAYNAVDSSRPNGDGFGWSIVGLAEEQGLFGRTSTVKDVFKIASGQASVRKVAEVPAAPEGWVMNETLPISCANLGGGKLLRIPSVSADALPATANFIGGKQDVSPPEDVHYYKDGADTLYIEVRDYNPSLHASMSFTVGITHPPFDMITDISKLFAINMTFGDYVAGTGKQFVHNPAESEILQGKGLADADKVLAKLSVTADSPIGETLETMYDWLWNWICEEIPRGNPSMIDAYLMTNAGACRHRTYIMFLALNRLGLPCRFLGSTCHAWAEIWNPDTGSWFQMDLNGCDGDPDGCPPCTIKNPWWGLREKCCPEGYDFNESGECVAEDGSGDTEDAIDCPKCIARKCPPDYYCDPRYGKCIPNCEKLYGLDYIYVGKRDECVNCADEDKVYDYLTDDCECPDCLEGFYLDATGHCIDEDGNLSDAAPAGLYKDRTTDTCLPKDDCDDLMPGAVFNEITGRCECMPETDEWGNVVQVKRWSDIEGRCVDDDDEDCPEGQMMIYDASTGNYRCVDIPDDVPLPKPIPRPDPLDPDGIEKEDEEEEAEDLIFEDDVVVLKLERWVNFKNGDISDTDPQKEDFKRIQTKQCRLQGRNKEGKVHKTVYNVFGDLHDLYGKWMKRDLDRELVMAVPPNSDANPEYVIYLVALSERLEEAKAHVELWKTSLLDAKDGIFGVRIEEVPQEYDVDGITGVLYAVIQE